MMNYHHLLTVLVLCSQVSLAIVNAAEVQEIAAAWKARAGAVSSLHVTWSATVTHYVTPGKEYSHSGRFALDDQSGRLRFDVLNLNPTRDHLQLRWQPSRYAYDGVRSVMLYGEDIDYAKALIGDGADGIGPDLRILPLRLFYRPFDDDLKVFDSEFPATVVSRTEYDGEQCVVLNLGRKSVWVTDDERLLPVRLVKTRQDSVHPSFEVRVEYAPRENAEWYPKGWTIIRIGIDGTTLIETRQARVESFALNSRLPIELFQIKELPHGTFVTDYSNDTSYIVRDGRPNRLVLEGEFTGHNYEQLLNSESPNLKAPSAPTSWLFIGNVMLLAVAVATISYRAWTRGRAKHRPRPVAPPDDP